MAFLLCHGIQLQQTWMTSQNVVVLLCTRRDTFATTAGSNGADATSESGMQLCAEGSYHNPHTTGRNLKFSSE